MTLRQVWVRLWALPYDSPFWLERGKVAAAAAEAAERDRPRQLVQEIDDTLAMFDQPRR